MHLDRSLLPTLLLLFTIQFNYKIHAQANLEPAITETSEAQQYLRMRWHGPMHMLEPMDVTMTFDKDGDFKRAWAWSEENNKLVYFPSNRKVRQFVEHGTNAPDLKMINGEVKGQINISMGNKPTPYLIDLSISNGEVSGQWIYQLGQDKAGTPLAESSFSGYLSKNRRSLQLSLKQARPKAAIKSLGKYAGNLTVSIRQSRDGSWKGYGFQVFKIDITENQFTAHVGYLDSYTRQEGVIFWNEYLFKGEIGEEEARGYRVTGTFTGVYNKAHQLTGKVTGAMIDEDRFKAVNPLNSEQDYPAYRGPYSDYRAHDQPYELVDDLRNAHLLWKSDPTPPGRAQDKRYFSNNHGRGIGGGGCSPILYDGKIYLFYIRPAGPDYDVAYVERIKKAGLPVIMDQWRIAADEYILCLDASTGRTLWRTRLPLRGLNYAIGSKSGGNMTPTAGDGMVYAIGSTLRIYGINASTGEMVWENHLGSKHHHLENQKKAAFKRQEVWSWNRDNNGSPIYVDGVVVVSNMDSERYKSRAYSALLGFDGKTGEKRWEVKGAGGANFTPATWTHQGKTYVIATGSGKDADGIYCIDPQSGELLWKAPAGYNNRGFTIHGDFILTNSQVTNDDKLPRKLACYSLKEKGKLLWEFEGVPNHSSMSHQIAYDNKAILQLDEQLIWVDLPTGKVLHRIKGRAANSYPLRVGDKALIEFDGTHSLNQYLLVDLKTKRPMANLWSPPHKQQTGYAHNQSKPFAEGRMYFRGGNNIIAYDLRKIMQVDQVSHTDGRVRCKVLADWLKDPDLKFVWSFSDGTRKEGLNVEHQFKLPEGSTVSTEKVRLEITSSNGMRRVAEQKLLFTQQLITAETPGSLEQGVLIDYFTIKPKSNMPLIKQLKKLQPAERWLYPTPNLDMAYKDKPGVIRVTGYIRVPEDGLYFFTPFRNSYSGSYEASGVQLYLGDLLTAQSQAPVLMRPLPLKAGLHHFTLLKPVDSKQKTKDIQLLLSPVSVSSWRKPLPANSLLRPKGIKNTTVWTGKRIAKPVDDKKKDDQAMEDLLNELVD